VLSEDPAVITVAEPIDADALRIRHEFLARPDLRLSVRTAALLLDISPRQAQRLLDALARERFLQQEFGGEYRRTAAARRAAQSWHRGCPQPVACRTN